MLTRPLVAEHKAEATLARLLQARVSCSKLLRCVTTRFMVDSYLSSLSAKFVFSLETL